MKPILIKSPPDSPLANIKIPQSVYKKIALGEVEYVEHQRIENQCPIGRAINLLEDNGWTPRGTKSRYPAQCVLGIGESIPLHDDPGNGVVAVTLLGKEHWHPDAQLITRHGGIQMDIGDTVIFDANKGHAWVCNTRTIAVSVCVKKAKVGK